MTDPDAIDLAYKKAERLLKRAGGDIGRVPAPIATFLRVVSAQSYLDDGGYRHFFEENWWPGDPSYEDFAAAYRDIGCHAQAQELTRVAGTFPFADPHLHAEQRNEHMDQNQDPDAIEITGWGDALCGDQAVWKKLEAFVLEHARAFGV